MNKSAVLASARAKFLWQQQPILSLGISLAREGNETKKEKKNPTPKSRKICQIKSSISLPHIIFWGKSAWIFFIICKGVFFKKFTSLPKTKKKKKREINTANAFVPRSVRGRDDKHAEWGGDMAVAEHSDSDEPQRCLLSQNPELGKRAGDGRPSGVFSEGSWWWGADDIWGVVMELCLCVCVFLLSQPGRSIFPAQELSLLDLQSRAGCVLPSSHLGLP